MVGDSKKPPESSDSNKAAPFEGAKRPSTEHVPLGIRPRKAPGGRILGRQLDYLRDDVAL